MTNPILRAGAQQIACPICHVPAGATCRNLMTGELLHARPAHENRLWAAANAGHLVLPDPPPWPDEETEDR